MVPLSAAVPQILSLLLLQGVWANPTDRDVTKVFQAWAVLEARHGTTQLARELFKCAVKADPTSEISWEVCFPCLFIYFSIALHMSTTR